MTLRQTGEAITLTAGEARQDANKRGIRIRADVVE